MQRLAIRLLSLFRQITLFTRKLRGKKQEDIAAQRVVSGTSWNEFCDTLKAAGASL